MGMAIPGNQGNIGEPIGRIRLQPICRIRIFSTLQRMDKDRKEKCKWRNEPLQVGFMAKDTDNKLYPYGAIDKGILYR